MSESGANSNLLKQKILRNAEKIVRLHRRIHETLLERNKSPVKRRAWEQACAELHARYDQLAFPGGYAGALDRISKGDSEAMEAAICFLECRPYFFRSGYMFKDIVRRCKRAPLSADQLARFKTIQEKLAAWRERKLAKKRHRFV